MSWAHPFAQASFFHQASTAAKKKNSGRGATGVLDF
jgi:hypothetical protein